MLELQAHAVLSFLRPKPTYSSPNLFPLFSPLWTRLSLPVFLHANSFFLFVSSSFTGLLFLLTNAMLSRLFFSHNSGLPDLQTLVRNIFKSLGNNKNLPRIYIATAHAVSEE